MKNKKTVITACIIASIQALLWIAGTIMDILLYTGTIKDFSGNFANTFYHLYFDNETDLEGVLVTPKVVFSFSLVQLVLSIIWLGLSLYIVKNYISNKEIENEKYFFAAWSGLTLAICITDLVLGAMLSRDFQKLADEYLKFTIIMLITSLRGGLFWCLNFGFAVFFLIAVMKTPKKDNVSHFSQNYINAFKNDSWIDDRIEKAQDNYGPRQDDVIFTNGSQGLQMYREYRAQQNLSYSNPLVHQSGKEEDRIYRSGQSSNARFRIGESESEDDLDRGGYNNRAFLREEDMRYGREIKQPVRRQSPGFDGYAKIGKPRLKMQNSYPTRLTPSPPIIVPDFIPSSDMPRPKSPPIDYSPPSSPLPRPALRSNPRY